MRLGAWGIYLPLPSLGCVCFLGPRPKWQDILLCEFLHAEEIEPVTFLISKGRLVRLKKTKPPTTGSYAVVRFKVVMGSFKVRAGTKSLSCPHHPHILNSYKACPLCWGEPLMPSLPQRKTMLPCCTCPAYVNCLSTNCADLRCHVLYILCMVPKERPMVLRICVDVHKGKSQVCRHRWVTFDVHMLSLAFWFFVKETTDLLHLLLRCQRSGRRPTRPRPAS